MTARRVIAVRQRMQMRRDAFGLRDLLTEAVAAVGGRPGRLAMTTLGTVLGIASVLVTIGLAQTAAGQINKRFDAIAATQAVAKPATVQGVDGQHAVTQLPWDSPERVLRLAGVAAAGTIADVNVGDAEVTAVPVHDPARAAVTPPTIVAGSPGLLDAVQAHIVTGRFFDSGHDTRADRVVVLGAEASGRLGIGGVERQPTIFIGQRAYQVIGILDRPVRRPDLLGAVIMPVGTARADFGLSTPGELQMHIRLGAGDIVGEQVPVALKPQDPGTIKMQVPSSTSRMRERVQGDVNVLFLALGGVALLIGAVGIGNVTLLSVLERTGEIGLRRALGAKRRDIAAQFMLESAAVGLLGGLIGAAVGIAVVVGVSALENWTPLLDSRVVIVAPLVGGCVGLFAGLYPALKAASIEPVAALRAGV
ncbi:ABC transporter permease [Cellulomonas sp.]|uniref:ABC transporter permease n=1 Tax=Cellulomonas sp. TaxID=40001 RepID=UPI001B11A511|nr:ABC transporter permease [Cellulomonas sp.]MBO9553222.1 ABC transporter permease [Cellulomonas sp.]